MTMFDIRPATEQNFVDLMGAPPEYSIQGFVIFEGDKPKAIGGLYYINKQLVIFSVIKEQVRPRAALEVAKRVMALVKDKKASVIAVRDPCVKTSINLLKHFGFEHVSNSPHGEVYQWQA